MPKIPNKIPQAAMPQESSRSRPTLTEEDWNFSAERVPDSELVPCLLFEILRESATVRELTHGLIAGTTGYDADARKKMELLVGLRININHALTAPMFLRCIVDPNLRWEFTDLLKSPWPKLHPKTKETLILCCIEFRKAAYISDCDSQTDQLAEAMRESVIRDMLADSEAAATAQARTPLIVKGSYEGRVIYGIVVDFAHYDDNAIRAALVDTVVPEIIKGRPKGINPQVLVESGRGRKDEWRGILNGLGMARLSARYSAQVLMKNQPKIYSQVAESLADKGTTAVQKKLHSARARFVDRFHEILPFEKLPPLCLGQSRSTK